MTTRLTVSFVLMVGVLFISALGTAEACTGIMLRCKDGSVVHGRTVEFGVTIELRVAFIPRGQAFVGTTPKGEGLKYEAKYATLGAITYGDVKVVDGINEKGLSAAVFYFPTFAQYTPVTDENQHKGLSPVDFPNWILTQFATVQEVRRAIESGEVVVTPTVIKSWGDQSPPFHTIVYDITGASIVIEPIDGKLVVYDNPIGVLTNSPGFDWHMTNLRNYIALDPRNVPNITVDGDVFKMVGQGNGMLGLPGDFTPPSRFIRAAVFSTTAIPSDNADEAVKQVFHILNNFDIPIGVARSEEEGVLHTDYTMFTAVRDPQGLKYYYKTYDDQTLRMVDMNALDMNGDKILILSTDTQQPIVDMTAQLKQ